jgi:SMC interacting uncharacterized protein involved in chromosome segregation
LSILTKEELEAMRKRAEAATPGPWYVDVFGDEVRSNESDLSVAYDITDEANAEFIAHAREDIPKLLAEIERLNDVIKQLTETTESFLEDKHFYMEELRKANAEIERYKKSLENIELLEPKDMSDESKFIAALYYAKIALEGDADADEV